MSDHLDHWAQHTKKAKKHRKPGTVLEKDVVRAIVQAFRARKITLFQTDAGVAGMRNALAEGARGYSALPAGFPDLMGVVPGSGRACFIEVKRPGNKPTDAQTAFLARVRGLGAIAFWADSVESAISQFNEQAFPGEAA